MTRNAEKTSWRKRDYRGAMRLYPKSRTEWEHFVLTTCRAYLIIAWFSVKIVGGLMPQHFGDMALPALYVIFGYFLSFGIFLHTCIRQLGERRYAAAFANLLWCGAAAAIGYNDLRYLASA